MSDLIPVDDGVILSEKERAALFAEITDKQQAWFLAFCSNGFNALRAAEDAGYDASSKPAFGVIGHDNRHHPVISRLIADMMARKVMSASEALARMSNIAESDLSNFVDEVKNPDGTTRRVPSLDKGIENGAGCQLKEISMEEEEFVNTRGRLVTKRKTKFKIHDPKPALDTILKAHGKLGSGKEGTNVNVNLQFNNQYWQSLEQAYGGKADGSKASSQE